jgi:hypothetical protein
LRDCDAAIIFYGQATRRWIDCKLSDLRRSSAERSTELLWKAVYIIDPITAQKEEYKSNEAAVIRERGRFPPTEMISFLRQVRDKARERKYKGGQGSDDH